MRQNATRNGEAREGGKRMINKELLRECEIYDLDYYEEMVYMITNIINSHKCDEVKIDAIIEELTGDEE
jgi:hypothetical protein